MSRRVAGLMLSFFWVGLCQAQSLPSPERCDLNVQVWEQARCLLSPVGRYGALGGVREGLPAPWPALLTEEARPLPTLPRLRVFLEKMNISERELGGDLGAPISRTRDGESARYFVIHDTSLLLGVRRHHGFSRGINSVSWSGERLRRLSAQPVAHVFVGRVGESATAVDFGEALLTTKFEKAYRDRLEGLFVGVENLQPRLLDGKGIDSLAPYPGFTRLQLHRLALVYVCASVRAGRWLVPAFHAVLDHGFPNAHDDPQNFDLAGFSAALAAVLKKIDS